MITISSFHRGDTRRFKCVFLTNTGTEQTPVWEPINISGWKLFLTFKIDPENEADNGPGVVQIETTVGDDQGGASHVDDAPNGVVYLVLPSDVSETLVPGEKYSYDLQRSIPSSPPDVKTIGAGKVKILQDVTVTAI